MSESIHDPPRLSFSGPSAVHEATLAARDFAGTGRIDQADAVRLAIIIEELVTNLYDHGGLSAEDVFELELRATDADIRLVLVDPGRPFDPARAVPDRSTSRGGGAGLKLIQAWAAHIDYRSTGGRNRLELLLPVSGRHT